MAKNTWIILAGAGILAYLFLKPKTETKTTTPSDASGGYSTTQAMPNYSNFVTDTSNTAAKNILREGVVSIQNTKKNARLTSGNSTVGIAASNVAIATGTKSGTSVIYDKPTGAIVVNTGGHYAKKIVNGQLTQTWVKD